MRIQPSKKIVVLKATKLDDIIKEKLTIVSTERQQLEIGEIIAIGEGKQPLKMKVGDIIAYRQYGGSKFYLGGQETIFVGFEDILGVIKK